MFQTKWNKRSSCRECINIDRQVLVFLQHKSFFLLIDKSRLCIRLNLYLYLWPLGMASIFGRCGIPIATASICRDNPSFWLTASMRLRSRRLSAPMESCSRYSLWPTSRFENVFTPRINFLTKLPNLVTVFKIHWTVPDCFVGIGSFRDFQIFSRLVSISSSVFGNTSKKTVLTTNININRIE